MLHCNQESGSEMIFWRWLETDSRRVCLSRSCHRRPAIRSRPMSVSIGVVALRSRWGETRIAARIFYPEPGSLASKL